MCKIRLCFVIVTCKITGPMNQTLNIIKYLDKEKYDVSFITLFPENYRNTMIDAFLACCSEHICLGLTKKSALLIGKHRLTKALEVLKPDIIQGLGMPPYRLSLGYKKAKHLVTIRNYAYEDYPSYYNKVVGPPLAFLDIHLIKRLQRQGEVFITCSKSLSDLYREKQGITFPFIRNGVDKSKFFQKREQDVNILREQLNLPKDKILLIYTGALNDRKDQETAIRGVMGCKNYDHLALVLCGDGVNHQRLYNQYGNEASIIFTGQVGNIGDYLRACDLYISTSKSEGLPNSVLEAMVSGLGVILSDIPQHMELLEMNQKIGYSYPLGNVRLLSQRIDQAVTGDYKAMGQCSFQVINDSMTAEHMSTHYDHLYSALVSLGGG